MAGEDVGFEGYLSARWNDLVRTLLALGTTVERAEAVVVDTAARVRSRFRREQRDGDVDVLVYGELLDRWRRADPAAAAGADHRELTVALSRGAGLRPEQIEEVLGAPPASSVAASRLDPPDLDPPDRDERYAAPADLSAVGAAVRRRRRRRAAGVAVVALVVALVAGFAVARPSAPEPPPDPPAPRNPIAIAWWADGVLHLDQVEVAVPGLRSLVQVGEWPDYGAVYTDRGDVVVGVGPDGQQTCLGSSRSGVLVGSSAGRVAWVDQGVDRATLVVADAVGGVELAVASVSVTSRPVAVDGDDVYVEDDGAVSRWRLDGDRLMRLADTAGRGLLDVAAGVELRRGAIVVDLAAIGAPPGEAGALAPDGGSAVVWTTGSPGARVERSSLSSRSSTPLDLGPGDAVLDAVFTPGGDVVLVLAHVYRFSVGSNDGDQGGTRSPYTDLVTCEVDAGRCTVSLGRGSYAGNGFDTSPVVLAR